MFINVLATTVTTCGDVEIPEGIVGVITAIYTVLKYGIPLALVGMGMLDLGKAVISQKEDDIKKNQGIFVKRLIAAAMVFFVLAIVELLIGLVDSGEKENIMTCIHDLISGGTKG